MTSIVTHLAEATDEPIDWQSAEVINRLLTRLMDELYHWREKHHRGHRDEADRADLQRALRFAGEQADGFQMARYLEDSKSWPANQDLVVILKDTRHFRDQTIKEIEQERHPPHPFADPPPWPVGTRFIDFDTTVYEICGYKKSDDIDQVEVKNMNSNNRFWVMEETVRDRIEQWGTV